MNLFLDKIFVAFYQIGIRIYGWSIQLFTLFNAKAKLWQTGRRNLFTDLEATFRVETAPVLWVHCASLGEFEQGRSLIERIKKTTPKYKILLTFFSPSGYTVRKNYALADFIFYLPLDTPHNAQQFVKITQPKAVFFIKYEFWYFHLKAIQQQQIPLFLVAGQFRKNQFFFKWYGRWLWKAIGDFQQLFLQDETSLKIIEQQGLNRGLVTGDTRVDRVWEIAQKTPKMPILAAFKGTKKLFVLGSTHAKDEQLFLEFIQSEKAQPYFQQWKFLIAPHDISETVIHKLQTSLPLSVLRFSSVAEGDALEATPILLLDTIGDLNSAYQYGDLAYIGGGFDSGIHNTLEPAAFGLPIIFGPNFTKFPEAKALLTNGGAFSIKTTQELQHLFYAFQTGGARKESGLSSLQYVQSNVGATQKIIAYLLREEVL